MNSSELERRVDELLSRGAVDVIDKEHLHGRMLAGETLRVKFGIDPTGPDIHIGRGSTIKKLREFQDLGHQIVLIIGDATAQIGDSSDKDSARKMLTTDEVSTNETRYLDQIGRIIDIQNTEIHHNSEWTDRLTPKDWIKLASLFTLQQITQRDNFARRIRKEIPVGFHEGLYCLLQGWDSVNIQADVEIGGTDQLFNLLAGRKIQEHFGQEQQDIMTLQLLAGTDGRKMSTSWGNVILVTEAPEEKYGKVMRIADYLIPIYLESATLVPLQRVQEVKTALEEGRGNPMDYKKELAYEIVKFYDGEKAAEDAKSFFEYTVQEKEIPEVIPLAISISESIEVKDIISHLVVSNIVKSKSEGKRLLLSGAISVDGKKLEDNNSIVINIPKEGVVVKAGKRKFLKITHS
ncbi:tyrosine--tRNA ligase [Candidatus Woesebacteria bacterium RBG_16_34_12]|uniref:Tyrosine--tRNA ligase n=1 Tax=Candidatus Woesebacteria bacterium RBG_16_34_12 TaxID=1802480 RepID=A0A1F7X965_9BACT|nr:MAG: tyrosine--tRNA ligase [Candidatus Woesebacteria bacterium RBG_16_34_12]